MGNQLQDVFVTNRVPTYTFVQPADFNRIILNLRTAGRPLVIEGPSGIGKTTAVQKAVDELKLRDKIVELKAGLAKDVELIDLLPELSNVGFVFVDDFHKLSDAVKAKIANYIKVLADEGNPNSKVIIAGISEAGKSLIKFAPDLVNRVDIVRFENNSDEKIDELISKGEAALKIMIHCKDEIIKESNGGFYIAQMLCSEVCQRSSVLEENESGALLDVTTSFEGAKSAIWRRIDDRFREPCKAFCLGSRYSPEGRAPYLHLLYWLASSGAWHIDINDHLRKHQGMRLSVGQVVDKGYLQDLFEKNPQIVSVLHYDPMARKLIIEDPQFLFYIRNLPWLTFAKDLGFRQLDFTSRYDFALSFAGADRDVAEAIFKNLSDRQLSVFYDKNEQDRIAAQNIEDYLGPIYDSEAAFVICVIGKQYPNRIWTRFESKAFEGRFQKAEVIPVLVIGTDISAFSKLSDIGYLNADRANLADSVDSICKVAVKKLTES